MGHSFFITNRDIYANILSRVDLYWLYGGFMLGLSVTSISLEYLHPSLGKREKTLGAVPPSPKKVFLVFPPKVTNAN